MNRILRSLFVTVLLALPAEALAGLKVVATVPDLAAVAQAVGGDHESVTAMALPTQDPHFVDAKPNMALALSRADALLVVGLGLESGWLPTLITGSRNGQVQRGARGYIDCSSYVELLDRPTGALDRSMGDLHGGGNPHYTYDPRRMIAVAHGVAKRFASLDSAHAEEYLANAQAFEADVQAALSGWSAQLAHLRGAKVIQYHRSWIYVGDWLGLQLISEVEPKPGIPPAPAQVASVVRLAQAQGVSVVLIESFYPQSTARLVAEKGGATLVTLQAGTSFGAGQTYIQHLDSWVAELGAAGR